MLGADLFMSDKKGFILQEALIFLLISSICVLISISLVSICQSSSKSIDKTYENSLMKQAYGK